MSLDLENLIFLIESIQKSRKASKQSHLFRFPVSFQSAHIWPHGYHLIVDQTRWRQCVGTILPSMRLAGKTRVIHNCTSFPHKVWKFTFRSQNQNSMFIIFNMLKFDHFESKMIKNLKKSIEFIFGMKIHMRHFCWLSNTVFHD